MGLAFDLNADDIGGTIDWPQMFQASVDGFAFSDFSGAGATYPIAERWTDIQVPADEFDIVIRNTYVANGNLIIVGSYKGVFTKNPHSIPGFDPASGQPAWDGFVAITRSFKWTGGLDSSYQQFIDLDGAKPFTTLFTGRSSMQILPMRMPYEWKPGGTWTQIAADSSVGLYGVDLMKQNIQLDSADIDLLKGSGLTDVAIVCGFGRVDASTEGLPIGQDYVAAAYHIPVQWSDYVYNAQELSVSGSKARINLGGRFGLDGQQYAGLTWGAGTTNHTDNTPITARFQEINLEDWLSDNTVLTPTDLSQPPPAASLKSRNYYPRRFLSVNTALIIDQWQEYYGPYVLAGDSAADDGAGNLSYYSPMATGVFTVYDSDRVQVQAIVATARVDANIELDGSVAAYNLRGAWFSHVCLTTDFNLGGFNNIQPPTFLLCENTDHGGATRQSSIYAMGGIDDPSSSSSTWFDQCPYLGVGVTPSPGAASVFAYAVPGGAWETATGLTLPDRWVATAAQSATFTRSEEDFSKTAIETWSNFFGIFGSSGSPIPNPVDENNVLVGVLGNYIRVGFNGSFQFLQGEEASNVAICLMGYTGTTGSRNSKIIVFDTGTVSAQVTNPTGAGPYNLDFTGYFIDVGSTMESAIIDSDADAIPVSAGWDNDRDQWLFGFNRPNVGKMALVSARSDFKEYIDQSANIQIPAFEFQPILSPPGYSFGNSIIFRNRLQTNELDGIGLGGDETDIAGPGFAISPLVYGDFGLQQSTNFIVVKGTTGRVARVWVDYVLYDGVDALISTKLSSLGLRVTPENVEWFKGKILRSAGVDELDVKTEEIEEWMEAQRKEYTDMMRTKERGGRLRKRRSQVSAYRDGIEGALGEANKSSVDSRALDPEDLDSLLGDVGMPDDGYNSDRKRS